MDSNETGRIEEWKNLQGQPIWRRFRSLLPLILIRISALILLIEILSGWLPAYIATNDPNNGVSLDLIRVAEPSTRPM